MLDETSIEDYESLLKAFKTLQKQYENVNQNLYDTNRQLKLFQAAQAECEEELRILQLNQESEKSKTESRIHLEFEEKLSQQKIFYNEKISTLEDKFLEKEKQNLELKAVIEKIDNTTSSKESDDNDNLLKHIRMLEDKNDKLAEDLALNEKQYNELKGQHLEFQETIQNLKNKNEHLKDNFDSKQEELDEANALIQNLNVDIAFMKMNFDNLTSKPLNEQTRGNSLFAEVNDKRVQLQQHLNTMKEKFNEMKRDNVDLLNENAKLRIDIAALHSLWKVEVEERGDESDSIDKSYKYQLTVLTDLIERYKKEIVERPKNENETQYIFFENMLEKRRAEVRQLEDKLFLQSFNYNTMRRELVKAKRDARKWKHEADLLENEVGALKGKIKGLPGKKIVEKEINRDINLLQTVEETILDSILDIVPLELDSNKENIDQKNIAKISKIVHFNKSVVKPEMVNTVTMRKGLQVHLPSEN